ncbi:sporulation protein Cse60 [Aneurinibacillus migulanus]|uniref:Sporulation protein Cse60 n=1 Tax=Aneurinibacillus migulanus TaxID=47500 RepID=A0A1G8HUZ1_ANEMI|nr:sporulation protein Cse60 [Aneurinibacillus migulanus]MCP1354483.1 sporulation protein Cse60 [Aneurinibacillus migulanus]MED0891579.1 sporulation protein Cse60 [Aneurinibacillus migulanus]MED1613732.1 sporulation protein Cse60 [Aneurinibacillus migulanus]MED4728990.1 sporulation protein Cse60 [Aneurinibacillus migulanus]SDI10483.1 Protein of unknown function [Aneurinibacillus migulanus]
MIQVKEFMYARSGDAERRINEFLAGLEEAQLIDIKYNIHSELISCILIVYKTC